MRVEFHSITSLSISLVYFCDMFHGLIGTCEMATATVLVHACVKIQGSKTIYVDPYLIKNATHDADIIYITHDHYDHFSEEDINKVKKADTIFVVPASVASKAHKVQSDSSKIISVNPDQTLDVDGIQTQTVPSYNVGKKFHPKSNGWVGYVLTVEGKRYYIAGDTDINPDVKKVQCDVAFVPVGGTYTMTAKEAAELVNH